MMEKIRELAKAEEGASLVEYALLVALIAVAAITAIGALSGRIVLTFTKATNAMPAS